MTPKPWPWNRLNPINRGNKLTVCISAVCGDAIIFASDRMISMGDI